MRSRSAAVFICASRALAICLGLLLRLLPLQLILDLGAHLGERPRRRRLVIDDLDDVEAERRLHQVADLAGLHRERGLLELRHHRAAAEVVEVAAVRVVATRPRRTAWPARRSLRRPWRASAPLRPASSTAASSLPSVLKQDVARARSARASSTARCSACRTPRCRPRGTVTCFAHLIDIDQRVADLALLADAIGLLVLLEVRRRDRRR